MVSADVLVVDFTPDGRFLLIAKEETLLKFLFEASRQPAILDVLEEAKRASTAEPHASTTLFFIE